MPTFAAPFEKRMQVKESKFFNRLAQKNKNWKILNKNLEIKK